MLGSVDILSQPYQRADKVQKSETRCIEFLKSGKDALAAAKENVDAILAQPGI